MTQFKFQVGQKVRIIKVMCPTHSKVLGAVTVINESRLSQKYGPIYVLKIAPNNYALECQLAPIDDNDTKPELSSWETLTKILGIDIRKEKEAIKNESN